MDSQTGEKKEVKDASGQLKEKPEEQNPLSPPQQQTIIYTDNLEKDWDKLQDEWKKLDEKQMQYLQNSTDTENGTPVKEFSETKPSGEDIEKKLAEYEAKNRELESMQESWKKSSAIDELRDDAILGEEPKPIKNATITKTAQETILSGSKLDSYRNLFKVKSPAAPEKQPEPVSAEKQKPKDSVVLPAAVNEETKEEEDDEWKDFPLPNADPSLKLKKKPGIMDKMRLLKNPVSVMVIDKIDGKKTIGQITEEIRVSPEEAANALEQLKKAGYI
jgi:hypothetical protein